MAPPRLLRDGGGRGRLLAPRDGDGAAMPLVRRLLFSRLTLLALLLSVPPVELPAQRGIIDFRDFGIRRRAVLPLATLLLLLLGLDDGLVGGLLAWTPPARV